jgi:hypothetical protein
MADRWFQKVLTAIECIIPAAFFGFAGAEENGQLPSGG